MSAGDGPPVRVWFETIGDGPSIMMEYDRACPSCGASWHSPGSVRLGGSASGTQFWCVACQVNHPELREPEDDETGPGHP